MSEWPTATLEELCAEGGGFVRTGPFGSQLHQSDYVDNPTGIPVVMPKDMSNGRVNQTTVARISVETAQRLAQHLVVPGDVILSRRGDVGRSVSIRSTDIPSLVGTGSIRIHLGSPKRMNPRYFEYFMRSRHVVDYLEGQAVGATMPNLNAGIVNSLPIFIPPEEHQHNTAEVLGSIDDLIENNRRRIEVLEEMAQAIYREWFVHFRYPGHEDATFVASPLGPIPEGWEVRTLFDVSDVGFGFSFKSKHFAEAGTHPVIRIRDVPKGTTATFSDEDVADRYRVDDGDVLIGMDGDFHLRQWTGETAWLNQRVARLRPLGGLSARHLQLAIAEPIKQLNESIAGTTVAHLGKRHLEQVEVIVPATPVLAPARLLFDDCSSQECRLFQANDRLGAIRDLLLPRLITGEIDVSGLDLDALVVAAS